MSTYDLLCQVPTVGLVAVQELFCTVLGYDRTSKVLPVCDWPGLARGALASPPTLLAQLEFPSGNFDIIFSPLLRHEQSPCGSLSLAAERLVVRQLLENHPHALYLFSDPAQQYWHLVNVPYDPVTANRRCLRRITVGPDQRLITASQRLAQLDAAALQPGPSKPWPVAIQEQHDRAFCPETLVEQFLRDHRRVHGDLRADLERETGDGRWAHDYGLQFLSRLMVLYFLQKQRSPEGIRWLDHGSRFLEAFWHAYLRAGCREDTFVAEWLQTLLFKAFTHRFDAGHEAQLRFPPDIVAILTTVPYLGDSVFERNELDRAYQAKITDARFHQILQFLAGYDFAIAESTPLDQELAVDPGVLGRVYEDLADAGRGPDARGEAGIFYTPPVEMEFMCRLSLKDWLAGHLGSGHGLLITKLLFSCTLLDKAEADRLVADSGLWPRLSELLRTVAVADPACGSGAFLVGMLCVLDDLLARANAHLSVEETPFERKRRIISDSLYGVDVMSQAAALARLRLWLQLAADAPRLPTMSDPVLPDLSFQVRSGDSLVQELAGMNLAVLWGSGSDLPAFREGIKLWQNEKQRFYYNDPRRQYASKQQMLQAESRLLRSCLEMRIQALDSQLRGLSDRVQTRTGSVVQVQSARVGWGQRKLERDREYSEHGRAQLHQALLALGSSAEVPFVWHMAFVEVFSRERVGFDIIIGNPPYVRQELIQDPVQPSPQVATVDGQRYRGRLARAVYANWPRTFGYDWVRDRARWTLDARSDLYIYCLLQGLALLHEQGRFCFLTSNSWLDVKYGRHLQEFLLTRGQVNLVIDNRSRRSFARAGVNTAIALLGPAHDTAALHLPSLRHVVRFVMLAVPFEEAIEPTIWAHIEGANNRCTTADYRVFPVSQAELLSSATDAEQKRFLGDRWGGKYLRAPDIYWRILEKHREKLVRLSDVARVRRGITTGANDFFFLDKEDLANWGIEEEFLARAVKSPRECERVWLDQDKGAWPYLFMCHRERNDLQGTAALAYIEYGEARGFHHRPTCRSRSRWWDVGLRTGARVHCNYLVGKVMRFYGSDGLFLASDNFQEIHSEIDPGAIAAACNSSLCQLFVNVLGRSNFGGGLLKAQTYEVRALLIPNPLLLAGAAGQIMRGSGLLDLDDPNRFALDDLIFDLLGLTPGERDAVHQAVNVLVGSRLSKADSRAAGH